MYLCLSREQAQTIVDLAIQGMPYEVCGALAGTEDYQVKEVIPLPNIAITPDQRYRVGDKALSDSLFRIRRSGLKLLGFYHSHPRSDPIPSREDIRQANYPDVAYLIVSLHHPDARLAAWSIRFQRVLPVELYIDSQPPPNYPDELSQAQIAAIILSILIAFIFLIVLSLALLPPAPIIPTQFP
jgi:proteasome lid subunit RPN8/RPN11